MLTVSAPGKLMLFGEHAVVYGRPCIVTAVDQRLTVRAERSEELYVRAPDMGVHDFQKIATGAECSAALRFVTKSAKNFLEGYNIRGAARIETASAFSKQDTKFGFGSSSAVTVCTAFALSKLYSVDVPKKRLFELCYKSVLEVQGAGSGFDVAAAIYGGTMLYANGGATLEPLPTKGLHLVVGYTGTPASTTDIIKAVKADMARKPEYYKKLYDDIERIVLEARQCILKSDWAGLGARMDENHAILKCFGAPSKKYGVSSMMIEKLVVAAREAGAYGAKLSGAGVGDCIIAAAPEDRVMAIESAIASAGGVPLKVGIGAEGVRLEA